MNLDDIKEQSIEQLNAYKERIQDSSIYNQLKERFDNLTPRKQKIVSIVAVIVFSYLVLSIPFSSLSEATDKISKYNSIKKTTASLKKVSDELKSVPDTESPKAASSLARDLKSMLEREGLSEDQILSSQSFKEDNKGEFKGVPGKASIEGVKVSLKQLNLKQIANVIYKAQRQVRPGKITHLTMNPTGADKAGFFNVDFEVRNFQLPKEAITPPADTGRKSRRNRRTK